MGKEPGPFGVGGGWGWGETDDSKVVSARDGWGGLAGEGLLRNAGSWREPQETLSQACLGL